MTQSYLRISVLAVAVFVTLSGCNVLQQQSTSEDTDIQNDMMMEEKAAGDHMMDDEGAMDKDAASQDDAMVAAGAVYNVATTESELRWQAGRITGAPHEGAVAISNGTVVVSEDQESIVGGTFEFDMMTITETTIENEEFNGKFIEHVKSDDFFAVEQFPQSTFVITNVESLVNGNATHTVTGDLTIRGITNQISFPATVAVRDGVVEAQASFTIDRTKWDVVFDSGSIFTNLGEKAIKDEITYSVSVVARQEAVMEESN